MLTIPNPYGIPLGFSYTASMQYLGFQPGVDIDTYGGAEPGDETAYLTLTWYSASPQPTWQDILDAGDNAWLGFFEYYYPNDYQVLRVNYLLTEKQDKSDALEQLHDFADEMHSDTIALLQTQGIQDMKDLMAHEMADVAGLTTAISGKVDKITGKGLSTEDYTTTEKTKLSGIATGATNTAAPIQADWNQATTGSLDYIKNKPTIPTIATQTHVNDAATNAATNAPTSLNVLTTLLGSLTGEVNATNTKQNDLATKYNDLATKFNTLLDKLEANALLATS